MRRLAFPLLIGLGGCAILVALGLWQVQRLAWKEGVLAQIEARIAAPAQPLPDTFDPAADRYQPVTVSGRIAGEPLRVLASIKRVGAVHRFVVPFETQDGRRILVDLGWRAADAAPATMPEAPLDLVGNLHWPRETDAFTPEPDGDLWFARDVPAMADVLDTSPVMVVLREMPATDLPVTPMPVDTSGIPNDHLQYAITWFSLAVIWAGMTLLFVRRTRSKES